MISMVFDPTISLGTLGAVVVFLTGLGWFLVRLGAYLAALQLLLRRFEAFMEESSKDRRDLRDKIDDLVEDTRVKHENNLNQFARLRIALGMRSHDNGNAH